MSESQASKSKSGDLLSLEALLYEAESAGSRITEEMVALCLREEVGLALSALAEFVLRAYASGVRIIVDVEPIQYESLIALLSKFADCVNLWRQMNIDSERVGRIKLTLFELPRRSPRSREVAVVVTGEKTTSDIWRDLETVLSTDGIVYFLLVPRKPNVTFSSALYVTNVFLKLTREVLETLKHRGSEDASAKLAFVSRVPYDVIYFGTPERLKTAMDHYRPPPPAYSEVLSKKKRRIDELVLPEDFRETVKQYVVSLRIRGRGTLALIGLPRSGRKTLAQAIAVELGLPAYWISVSSVLGMYVGESEGKLMAFFESLRARGGLAVFDSVDALFKRGGNEQVSSNLKSILFNELSREDNNFVMVFTLSEDSPGEALYSPLLGELKLVVPLPSRDERRALARKFLWEIVEESPHRDRIREIASRVGAEVFERMYAEPFVQTTAGMTSGEIYQAMEVVLHPAFVEMAETGKLVDVTRSVIRVTRRDLGAVRSKIRALNRVAVSLGLMSVAQSLKNVYTEVLALDKHEESKKYVIE